MKNSEQGESYSQSRAGDRPHVLARQALLPEQHFDRLASRITDAPERHLIIAILINAVLELRSRDARDVIDAEHWVRSDDSPDWPFSFNNICQALGMESSYLRRGLLAWCDRSADAVRRPPIRHTRIWQAPIAPSRERHRRAACPPR